MKLVINKRFGGFGLSKIAQKKLLNLKGKEAFFYKQTKYNYCDGVTEYKKVAPVNDEYFTYTSTIDLGDTTPNLPNESYWYCGDLERHDADLIKVVEELGDKADGEFAELKVVDIPDGIEYTIEEYDGKEWVAEKHETWG